jgi:hypothetical protein
MDDDTVDDDTVDDDKLADGSWPVFALVPVDAGPGVPAPVAGRLADPGVPKGLIGHEYRALAVAAPLPDAPGPVVAFGSCGLRGRICVDAGSLAVVHVAEPGAGTTNPVNSHLDLFAGSVRAVIDRFPFYDLDADLEERERIAAELRAVLHSIDSSALDANGFWTTFLDDLTIGDYATEEIVDD